MQTLVELERRAQLGEVDALTELGRRLLVGKDAPAAPHRGAELLHAAAEKGGSSACGLVSVLLAADAPPGERWSQALDYLTRAAELGDAASRRQLALLCADAELAAAMLRAAPGEKVNWSAVRHSVQLDDWSRAPALRPVADVPFVALCDGFIAQPICDWMIERARQLLHEARTYDPQTGASRQDRTRTNSAAVFEILEADIILLLIRLKIATTIRAQQRAMENSQVLHYAPGQEFKPHYDFLDPRVPALADDIARNGQRVATFLIYLNEGFDGGETDFPHFKKRFKGPMGSALFFLNVDRQGQPNKQTLHAGLPTTRGEKWLFSQWVKGKPAAT